jgi:hypothetical protein
MPSGDTVLVLTGPDDPTADAVINALAAHPVRVVRMDTETSRPACVCLPPTSGKAGRAGCAPIA